MTRCLFVADLHGDPGRYAKLWQVIASERPDAVMLGGDLLPGLLADLFEPAAQRRDFVLDVLAAGFADLQRRLGDAYPRIFVILGNDDGRIHESTMRELEERGLWHYAHGRRLALGPFRVYGYSYVPPTPFALKDWERYDISRHVEPGCVPPDEGRLSVRRALSDSRYRTIQEDLEALTGGEPMGRAVLLFHAPPYQTKLDRAALDGQMIDHAPLDVNIGSVAVRRFLEARQPLVSLHGHVHESARLTGSWRDRIGKTVLFTAAHDGPELAVVRFDLERLDEACRLLL
ncbi:MAG: metallophosphoesterase [Acidobacteriota bacterium]|nr:metallophosphoesterase [Acidobacteriota bacterium]MDH3523934.1 metallophosphoesterase [Acidobacteriota bacterium]